MTQEEFNVVFELQTRKCSDILTHKKKEYHYEELCAAGIVHDAAGYATPQGLRNVLIVSATPPLPVEAYDRSAYLPEKYR